MKTSHKIIFDNANAMSGVDDESIGLMVTSPPYPMIEMWDDTFASQNPMVRTALENNDGMTCFELMHRELDRVWNEVGRVLIPGGLACVNIGDATRSVNSRFRLYPSHSRIISTFLKLGFDFLPAIIWRKQTNAPNKFMGSGMLPAGAYVTLEHEFVLIFRKGGKREFKREADKQNRRSSALFWEERNTWFSDVWFDIKGVRQVIDDEKVRDRSGAFPFELAYRLINMFSVKGDWVLDPFMGTGTTQSAAVASARNSIGYEIDHDFKAPILSRVSAAVEFSNAYIDKRISNHLGFVEARIQAGKALKHKNHNYDFPVVTAQERDLFLNPLIEAVINNNNTV